MTVEAEAKIGTTAADDIATARAEPLWPPVPVWARLAGGAAALLLLAWPFVFPSVFAQHVMILVLLYALMAQSWNVVAGLSGQISLGHAVFFGLGAYTSALLYVKLGVTPWLGAIAAIAVSALVAALIGIPTLRIRGHYFAIATLLIGASVQIVFQRWEWVGGASALQIPLDRTAPWLTLQFHRSKVPYYYLALGAAALGFALVWWLKRTRLGFRLQALRDDPDAAASLGIDVSRHKVMAFMVSGGMMALAGALYAQYVLVIDPERVFAIEISIMVVLMTVLGGTGTLWGPALGAAILIPLSEWTRVLLGGTGKAVDLFVYGVLIMAVCIWRPAGILSLIEERQRRRGARR